MTAPRAAGGVVAPAVDWQEFGPPEFDGLFRFAWSVCRRFALGLNTRGGCWAVDYAVSPCESSRAFATVEAARLWCAVRSQHPLVEVGGEIVLGPIAPPEPEPVIIPFPQPPAAETEEAWYDADPKSVEQCTVEVEGVDGVRQVVPAADAPSF